MAVTFYSKNSHEDIICFTYIGAVLLFIWLLKLLFLVSRKMYMYLCRLCEVNVNWKQLPNWAVITGGSDGIGRAYAEELASKGFNIALISRTREKLQVVASEIAKQFDVKTRVICIDFTDEPDIYKIISEDLSNLEIGVLVNNVGMSYEYPEHFHAINNGIEVMEKLIRSNVVSCTMMMRILLPGMLARGKGVIINISSLTAIYPMPMLNVYAACKAYVDYLARATAIEYKDKGIIIQSVMPGYVATNMSKRRINVEVPSAEYFVNCAIRTVGLETTTFGYFPHKIRGFVHEWLKANMPTCVNMAIATYYMQKAKDRYLMKKKRC